MAAPDLFLAQQHHPLPRFIQLNERALQQLVLQFGMFACELVERRAMENAYLRVAQCGHAVRAFLAKGAADEIGREYDADNLFPAICCRNAEFENTGNDIRHDQRVIALPNQCLSALYSLLTPLLA